MSVHFNRRGRLAEGRGHRNARTADENGQLREESGRRSRTGMCTKTRDGGLCPHYIRFIDSIHQSKSDYRRGVAHGNSHKQGLLGDVRWDGVLVHPVVVGRSRDRAFLSISPRISLYWLANDVPGPSPLPETNDLESKNHMIKAGAQSPSFAYTGTPDSLSVIPSTSGGSGQTIVAIAVWLGTDVGPGVRQGRVVRHLVLDLLVMVDVVLQTVISGSWYIENHAYSVVVLRQICQRGWLSA